MSEEKIIHPELVEIFGDTMPIEAVTLLWNSPEHWTVGQMRAELRKIGKGHKRFTAACEAAVRILGSEPIERNLAERVTKAVLLAADAVAPPGGPVFDLRQGGAS